MEVVYKKFEITENSISFFYKGYEKKGSCKNKYNNENLY